MATKGSNPNATTNAKPTPPASPPAVPKERALSEQLKDRGVSNHVWHTLCHSIFPGAKPSSVLSVIDYCKARGLDPLKKPCHIVPMKVRDAQTGNEEWRDVVLAGIAEQRITAHRTGSYLGHSTPEFGPPTEVFGVEAPAWCAMTFRRRVGADIAEFPVRVLFTEVVGTAKSRDGKPYVNARWSRAPVQMLSKCTEGAGLREAFPEEVGAMPIAEEADEAEHVEATIVRPSGTPQPPDLDELNAQLGLTEDGEPPPDAESADGDKPL